MPVTLLTTPKEVRAFTTQLRAEGTTLALVPTMGFLHQGHESLMREGAMRAGAVVVSIFVNPTQFGPKEDLATYPRDLEGDLKRCDDCGVRAVYAPEASTMYPEGFQTFINVEKVSQGLCGAKRPGHFRGVATVVAKLFTLFSPKYALFGEKDYQQLQVIRQLNADMDYGIDILGMPTVRDTDGLAMSSRNSYLLPDERKKAVTISQALFEGRKLARSGEHLQGVISSMRRLITSAGITEDYLEVVDAQTLVPLKQLTPQTPARALIAAYVGKTRLIDNMAL